VRNYVKPRNYSVVSYAPIMLRSKLAPLTV